ncbi:MAG TPA: D-glycero-beta-D-manno-heptose 1-phosphate adenylyltransferase [Candidatus Cloacimonetes bacterium]|nr:D-glycero-beta-D-manno-heptose 1-phosphate adenylyltransferase [Candidatus Cloacimonadota bacterium]
MENKMKLKTWDEIKRIVKELKKSGKQVVFTNGCFDIIHAGHVQYLQEAKNLGDILIIGLNSDESVRKLKGKNRPLNNELNRAIVLSGFYFVDYVVIFEEDTPYDLINLIKPDILVKGGDWKIQDIVGSDIVLKKKGKVKSLSFKDGFSTTKLINKIKKEKDR